MIFFLKMWSNIINFFWRAWEKNFLQSIFSEGRKNWKMAIFGLHYIFITYTLFMCQVEISIRDSNLDPGPKFWSETQFSIRNPNLKFGFLNEIWVSERNFDFISDRNLSPWSKFESRIQIWVPDPNLSPGSKFESRIQISTWPMNRVVISSFFIPMKWTYKIFMNSQI